VFWFDHWVPARNVKFTFILFTCWFNCRGCSNVYFFLLQNWYQKDKVILLKILLYQFLRVKYFFQNSGSQTFLSTTWIWASRTPRDPSLKQRILTWKNDCVDDFWQQVAKFVFNVSLFDVVIQSVMNVIGRTCKRKEGNVENMQPRLELTRRGLFF